MPRLVQNFPLAFLFQSEWVRNFSVFCCLLLFIEASAQHKDACLWNSFQNRCRMRSARCVEGRQTEIMEAQRRHFDHSWLATYSKEIKINL